MKLSILQPACCSTSDSRGRSVARDLFLRSRCPHLRPSVSELFFQALSDAHGSKIWNWPEKFEIGDRNFSTCTAKYGGDRFDEWSWFCQERNPRRKTVQKQSNLNQKPSTGRFKNFWIFSHVRQNLKIKSRASENFSNCWKSYKI